MSTDVHVQEPSHARQRTKAAPKTSAIPATFFYAPSDDGTDENLVILLHGLGDTHVPFIKLGRGFKLPQTAMLSLCAPEQVPFLYEDSYQWYPSFTALGEHLPNPNPTPALDLMTSVLHHLTTDCEWLPSQIHLFGFAQGGTVAAEFALHFSRLQPENKPLGSITTVGGPLISYPTISKPCPTPILVFHRPPPSQSALLSGALAAFRKGFGVVEEVKVKGEGMPRSADEWRPIMKFWSEKLGRRVGEGAYEVMVGKGST